MLKEEIQKKDTYKHLAAEIDSLIVSISGKLSQFALGNSEPLLDDDMSMDIDPEIRKCTHPHTRKTQPDRARDRDEKAKKPKKKFFRTEFWLFLTFFGNLFRGKLYHTRVIICSFVFFLEFRLERPW